MCSYAGCDLYSLAEQVSRASRQPENSMIVTPATVWVDDYMDWIDPKNKCCYRQNCCPAVSLPEEDSDDDRTFTLLDYLRYENDSDDTCDSSTCDFCSAGEKDMAPPIGRDACRNCFPRTLDGETEVTDEDFLNYLDYFLKDNPDEFCSKGGHASYGDALNIERNDQSDKPEYVESSFFMAYHRVCIKSAECQVQLKINEVIYLPWH